MISTIAAVLHNRRTVIELARRDFRARYAGSVLGLTWSVLEPMVQFGLYFVVFSSFLGMRFVTASGVNMTGFYLVGGLIPYLALQEMLVRAAGLVRGSAQLIRHVVILSRSCSLVPYSQSWSATPSRSACTRWRLPGALA
jgi:ABC-type polysaccharide/polyol phosphate export permease